MPIPIVDNGSALQALRKRVALYRTMFGHWWGMLSGGGYWHAPQGLGTQFACGELQGYFNDLTHKVQWSGDIDDRGVLLNRLPSGKAVYFPTAVFQKSLGHWDMWLRERRASGPHRVAFLAGARWALDHQDRLGGWTAWSQLGLHYESAYSAMTQGQGASLLVRAFSATKDARFLEAARRALVLMLTPVNQGGVARDVPEGVILEEAAVRSGTSVLNGWIFALFGLHDFLLARHDEQFAFALSRTLDALCAWLPRFHGQWWSHYDTDGTVASPFYHNLHIAQLAALELAFPARAHCFAVSRRRFEGHAASRVLRARAVVVKALQKLRHPPDVVLR